MVAGIYLFSGTGSSTGQVAGFGVYAGLGSSVGLLTGFGMFSEVCSAAYAGFEALAEAVLLLL